MSGRLRRVGETCLWCLVIGATAVAALLIAERLRLIVLPVMLAVVLATFLEPPVRWLRRRGWPDAPAALCVLAVSVSVMGGGLALLAPRVTDEFGALDVSVGGGLDEVQQWLEESPLPISSAQVSDGIDRVQSQARESVDELTRQAISGALTALEVLAGLALSVVVLFFLLKDGARIWRWVLSFFPSARRADVQAVGERSWRALGGFLRGQSLVALFDAVLIGLALVIIGIPLALPLAVLTFFGAFVPIIGATVTGVLAVLVAVVSEGPIPALLVLAAILLVQQAEGNLFQPLVVGRAIDVHPLAVLLGVTAGGVLAGIIGAMIAAPLVAVGGAVLAYARDG